MIFHCPHCEFEREEEIDLFAMRKCIEAMNEGCIEDAELYGKEIFTSFRGQRGVQAHMGRMHKDLPAFEVVEYSPQEQEIMRQYG